MLEKFEPLKSKLAVIINGKKRQDRSFMTKAISFPSILLRIATRGCDIFFGAIALIQLSPVFLVISLALYITSGRPIFFRQKRPGKGGELFGIYKFRTMRKDSEAVLKRDPKLYSKYIQSNCKIEAEEDPRITKIGCFLRRWSLDEMPQFINVIKGDMSIIGPRPVLPEQLEEYGDDVEEFLSVRPGITGLWQVTGRSEISYPERKYIDLAYIRNKSIKLDLKIFLKTIKVVLAGKGAY